MNTCNDSEFTLFLDPDRPAILLLDQTLLPAKKEIRVVTELPDLWESIRLLRVRGAPAIGVVAAMGMYLAAEQSAATEKDALLADLSAAGDYLKSSRPTAVNLAWAVDRMLACARQIRGDAAAIRPLLRKEATAMYEEDASVCRRIGEFGLTLVSPGDGVLTHCNAGRLATVRYGTATAPMYLAKERNIPLKIYCDETRPLLQGARLTAYELSAVGCDVTLLCDNMSGSLMRSGRIQAVFVGCDRVAANGDTANKIGTSMVAALAARYRVPFYVCAPYSTIDLDTPDGSAIPIEQRDPDEVTELWYQTRMAPQGIGVYNPAFDVTDAELITAFVTEYGILRPPYGADAFRRLRADAEQRGKED